MASANSLSPSNGLHMTSECHWWSIQASPLWSWPLHFGLLEASSSAILKYRWHGETQNDYASTLPIRCHLVDTYLKTFWKSKNILETSDSVSKACLRSTTCQYRDFPIICLRMSKMLQCVQKAPKKSKCSEVFQKRLMSKRFPRHLNASNCIRTYPNSSERVQQVPICPTTSENFENET